MSRLRLGALAAGVSLALAAVGLAREVANFGWSDTAGVVHLQQEISRRVTDRARALEILSARVARDASTISRAVDSEESIPDLFTTLEGSLPADDESLSVTVWVPAGTAGGYRVLAWSGGPAENVAAEVLSRAPALTVATGAGGLRLVFVQPVFKNNDPKQPRIAVASAETVIAPSSRAAAFSKVFVLQSSIGLIPVVTAVGEPRQDTARITSPAGAPLLDATIDPSQLALARQTLRWRAAGLALMPWVLWLLLNAAVVLRDRAGTRRWTHWFSQTVIVSGLIAVAAVAVILLARAARYAPVWIHAVEALAALALVANGPASAWWRRVPRASPARQPLRWFFEHLLGGIAVAAALVVMVFIWRDRVTPTSVENWQLPALGADLPTVASLCAVLLGQIAATWFAAGTLGVLAARWTLTGGRLRDWAAVLLWVIPPIALALPPQHKSILPLYAAVIVVASIAAFGVLSLPIRKNYRATSEARRLVFRFAALLLPIIAVFPLAAASADLATREIIEHRYDPAVRAVQEPKALKAVLERAQQDVDGIPNLKALLSASSPETPVPSQAAFTAWARTVFSRERATSELELYNADKLLVSHFSLNVPEFGELYQTGEPVCGIL